MDNVVRLNKYITASKRNTMPSFVNMWKELKPEYNKRARVQVRYFTNGVDAVSAMYKSELSECYVVIEYGETKAKLKNLVDGYIDRYGTYIGNKFYAP